MLNISRLPLVLLARAIGLGLWGRVYFQRDSIGYIEHGKDEDFKVFRKVILKPSRDQPKKPGAILIVRFRFSRFGARTNRFLSLIPIPFILAQQGFRSKTWMIGQKTGAFQGSYEWDSIGDAEKYWTSFPMNLMRRRAAPETLNYEVKAV